MRRWLVPVPPAVSTIMLAARGYINPLTAMLMLKRWPVAGKHLAADRGIVLLRQSAGTVGAGDGRPLGERDYSLAAAHRARLQQHGRDLSDPRYATGR